MITSHLSQSKKKISSHGSKVMHSKLLILINITERDSKRYIIWLSVFGLLDMIKTFIFTFLSNDFRAYSYIGSMTCFSKIFIFPVLNSYFFNASVFKHHWVSIAIVILGFTVDYALNPNDLNWSLFLSAFAYWIDLVLLYFQKRLMHFKYLDNFFILLIEGLSGLVILFLITYLVPGNILIDMEDFRMFTVLLRCNPFLLVSKVFLELYFIFKYLTNQYYSPMVLMLNDLIVVSFQAIRILMKKGAGCIRLHSDDCRHSDLQ